MKHFLVLLVALTATFCFGHPMPSSALILRLHGGEIDAEVLLPVAELKLGWDKPFPLNDADVVVRDYGQALKGYVVAHVRPVAPDGRPWTVRVVGGLTAVHEAMQDVRLELVLAPPSGAPADRLTLNYDVILHHLVTHSAIVSIASDWRGGQLGDKPVVLATLWDQQKSVEINRSSGSWWRGFAATFRMGARHIADGTDHLLFLLALLLPAPLLAAGARWGGYAGGRVALRRIAKVVTAFTLGHSLTLILGALGVVHVPQAPIEAAIALSIFVSAIHALVPIFRGREVFIAGGFGLVHGLSFAAVLGGFGFDPLTLVSSIFGFNLGIEAFQLLVILVTIPWLVLLARTRAYPTFRVAGAFVTGLAAATWFFERAFGWANPVGPWVERAAGNALWIVAGLAVVSLLARRTVPLKSVSPDAVSSPA